MIFTEEIYFEINLRGLKSELKKMVRFLKSGELDDFFEINSEYIVYDDDYAQTPDDGVTGLTLTNDDIGVETDELDTDEFLDLFCKAAKNLEVIGHLYDIDDEEYSFRSAAGDDGYTNARGEERFNDELDEVWYEESRMDDDDPDEND